jgi:hypothetical protein
MSKPQSPHPLDASVAAALAGLELARPRALLALGTGIDTFAERLSGLQRVRLPDSAALPSRWRGAPLCAGALAGLPVWLLADTSGDSPRAGEAEWAAGWPFWLAARAGARVFALSAAGLALDSGSPASELQSAAGSLAFAQDHLNLSGSSPLVGLAESTLGPLFPDLSALHDAGLRQAALAACRARGIAAFETVVAATAGPSLATPAERRYYARAGAGIAVQGLAAPLLAAAHAGLCGLTLVAVAESGQGPADLPRVLGAAERALPALEDVLASLAPALAVCADAQVAEDA